MCYGSGGEHAQPWWWWRPTWLVVSVSGLIWVMNSSGYFCLNRVAVIWAVVVVVVRGRGRDLKRGCVGKRGVMGV